MIYEWQYDGEQEILLRTFLRNQGFSKRLLAEVKFHGGQMWLNGEEQTVRAWVKKGDFIKVLVPDEGEHETTVPSDVPITILYEDDHFLIVNKPAGVASIPSRQQPNLSMANRVKGYYQRQGYKDQVIHIVTRLDRDTTGNMLFAKNAYTHALMDQQLRAKTVEKIYYAILAETNALPETHGLIDAPIGRTDDSIINRMVREDGKPALTEYWIEEQYPEGDLIRLKLHTGRTHQIRVHLTHAGSPLLGDDLYGGRLDPLIDRQALHCKELSFLHPFTKEVLKIESELPPDFQDWISEQKKGGR
ncbi:RluA family pseudouridine synthase [Jeotgalibaca caeni]|uniref:RluA family pseudouridine synthase n=1 Tax=Jeotgalibaca caeni TaxID=3028623 RepID=UPI00237EA0CA|nr:RluA family pseudouridine synthase [Jeotgalibaca caeni]MDE1547966.1 RluA family pseudouridine synthase [Jeotgalibaca caeni]